MKNIWFLIILFLNSAIGGINLYGGELITVKLDDFRLVNGYWTLGEWGLNTRGNAEKATMINEFGKRESMLKINYQYFKSGFGHFFIFYNSYVNSMKIPGKLRKISFKLKGSGVKHTLLAVIRDSKDRNIGIGDVAAPLDKTTWRDVSIIVPESTPRQGQIVFPVSMVGFQIHNWGDQNNLKKLTCYIRDLEVTTEVVDLGKMPMTAKVYFKNPTGFFDLNEDKIIFVRLYSWSKIERKVKIIFKIMDVKGRTVYTKKISAKIFKDKLMGLKLPIDSYGGYFGKIIVLQKRIKILQKDFNFAVTPKNENVGKKLHSIFGCNVNINNPFSERLRRIGVKFIRTYFWYPSDWNPRKGVYDFQHGGLMYNKDDRVNHLCGDYDIYEMPTIDGPPKWNAKYKGDPGFTPPKNYSDYADTIKHFASHFKGKIPYVEVYNEPGLVSADKFGGKLNIHKTLYKIMKYAREGIDKGYKKMKLVYTGLAGFEPTYYAKIAKLGFLKPVVAVNGHYYCFNTAHNSPETDFNQDTNPIYLGGVKKPVLLFIDRLRLMNKVRKKYFPNKEIWLTETGWDDTSGTYAVGFYLQAAYLARLYLWGISEQIDKIFWYWFENTPWAQAGDRYFGTMGLFNNDWQPKPCAAVYNLLTNLLHDAKYYGDLLFSDNNVYSLVFVDAKKQPLMTIWADVFRRGKEIKINLPQRDDVKLIDVYGNEISKSGDSLYLTDQVIYIKGLKYTDKILAPACYHEDALRDWPTFQGNTEEFEVVCDASKIKRRLSGRIKIDIPADFKISPSKQISFNVSAGKKITKKIRITIPFSVKGDKNPWQLIIKDNNGVNKVYKKNFRIESSFIVTLSPLMKELVDGPELKGKILYYGAEKLSAVGFVNPIPGITVSPSKIDTGLLNKNDTKEFSMTIKQTGSGNIDYSKFKFVIENKKLGIKDEIPIKINYIEIRRLKRSIIFDGRLNDWSKKNLINKYFYNEILGGDALIYAGWRSDGLYFAFKVKDKEIQSFPTHFWDGDTVEIWVDTKFKRSKSFAKGVHQFYITVPSKEKGGSDKVIIGQWHREGDDIEKNINNVLMTRKGFRKTGNGYVLEVFIPNKALHGFTPSAGKKIGLNINISYKEGGEVSWGISKKNPMGMSFDTPVNWGIVKLK